MSLRIAYQPYVLHFYKEAGTSRGTLTQKTSWFIRATDNEQPGVTGYGECGPLPGLSVDDLPDFEVQLREVCDIFNELDLEVYPFNLPIILDQLIPAHLPSVRCGIETALLDFMNGGNRILFKNAFIERSEGILMNGLIWMGSFENMLEQVEEKLEKGFSTLKMKVGAIDFDKECAVLESIRSRFGSDQITLRVDANGAFTAENVRARLNALAAFDLHSIEQPVKPGQPALMKELCATSPVPIALDEELIGIVEYREKLLLLKDLQPTYIILKPSLLGGFGKTNEWIEIANRLHIDWWVTSALESNIGLNAIAQYTAAKNNPLPQGLGTGQLYANNIASPLTVNSGRLFYHADSAWDLSPVDSLF